MDCGSGPGSGGRRRRHHPVWRDRGLRPEHLGGGVLRPDQRDPDSRRALERLGVGSGAQPGIRPPDRPGPGDPNLLTGAAVTSARNAWAVGYYANAPLGEGAEQTLIEHWNGQAWKIAPSPNPGGSAADNSLHGVTAVSPTDAWAVGYYSRGGDHTIIEHWNGHAWHAVQSPDPAGSSG